MESGAAGCSTSALDDREGERNSRLIIRQGPGGATEVSRAAATAHRRMSASAARRGVEAALRAATRTSGAPRRNGSEVLLLTSKGFPSQQFGELMTFLRGLNLPPDVTSLFTTVGSEDVAGRKALLDTQSQELVDDILGAYGDKLTLLTHATSEVGTPLTHLSPCQIAVGLLASANP